MIKIEKLSFSYEKGNELISDLSLEIEKGQSVGLIGANGAGKSTFMRLLLGNLTGSGSITINGTLVSKENQAQNYSDIGYLFQNSDHQMFMPTVYEDLLFGLLNNGVFKEEADRRIDDVLHKLDIVHLKNRYNHKISIGEKKMAALATILAMEPQVLLLDEPTAGLDPCNRRRVIRIINELPQTRIIASHDLDMIADTCDEVLLLNNGKLAAKGKALEILHNKNLLEANRLELPLSFTEDSSLQ